MTTKKIIGITAFAFGLFTFLLCGKLTAQTIDDVVRFNERNLHGTARGFAMGSSLGSIGGDFGSTSSNPASAAMYRFDELEITPGMYFGNAVSELLNAGENGTEKNRSRFVFPSGGYVKVRPIYGRTTAYRSGDSIYYERSYTGWTRTVVALGINRSANFNQSFDYSANQSYSITEFFIEQSNGLNPDNLDAFYAGPAYDAFITLWDNSNDLYSADIDALTQVEKMQTVKRSGGVDELTATFAADYSDKFQIGGSLNIPVIYFKEKKKYEESLDGHSVFDGITFEENLTTEGSGLNLKLGAKYILAKKIHLSAAFHSPTWYGMTEEFDTRAEYRYIFDPDLFDEPGPKEGLSPLGTFQYRYRTPWRLFGGLGAIIGRIGLISAEVEYVDHTTAKFNIADDETYANELNIQINNDFDQTLAIRIGGEIRLDKFRLRGGYGLQESMFADQDGLENTSLSAGIGVWIDRLFLDLGYRRQSVERRFSPYTLFSGPSPIVSSDFTEHIVLLTAGIKI